MTRPFDAHSIDDETCPKCGSIYSVTQHRYPARERGQFKCEVCGHVVRTWNDTYDWSHKLKVRGTPPQGSKQGKS